MITRRAFLSLVFAAAGVLGLGACAAVGNRDESDQTGSEATSTVDASVAAVAMLYSFYGRLSWAEKSADVLRAGKLPPTYYCFGTEDPFFDQFEGQVDLMASLGCTVRARVLNGWPHGFGAEGCWVPEFDRFVQDTLA